MPPFEEQILKKILPSTEEDRRIQGVVRDVMRILDSKISERGLRGKPLLVGSVAKGVHLTGTEIDIFVAFPPDTPREVLEREGLALGDVLERPVRMYAEHPYTRGWHGGFEVEIVPCYRITDATQRMSAVDRTPLHVDYVLGHLKEGQANEVRLLKAWAEGIGVYGAEAKVLGFSGYLCELLVLKFGSFRGVLENSLSWRPGLVIELERGPARTFAEPLVVVDPVDPNRNVASAVGLEQLATFVHAAREYLPSPTERFFFPRPLKPLPVAKLRVLVGKRGAGLLAISLPAPPVTEDVLYPQLRKAHRSFGDLLHRHAFHVFDSRFDVVGKEAVFLFELDVDSLPKASRHEGPPVWVKNAKDFLDKWRRSAKRISGPYIHGERWVVDVTRDATTAASLVKAKWRDLGLGKDLEKTARRSLRIRSDVAALRIGYAEAWTRLFDKRFPWER
jgi:tRNA nucleotidyltransferase (CCA-adding enzyme)